MPTFTTIFKYVIILLPITDITGSTNVISCPPNDCQNTTINCPNDNNDCFVSCSTTRGCLNSVINCPKQQECEILCDDIESCKGSTINATHSSILDITGCNQDQSCFDLNIYCPQDTQNQKNCFIEGNDNVGPSIIIHAVYGWNQIDIKYNGSFSNNNNGKLYCNSNYDTSCDIASDQWSCTDTDHHCNNIYISTTNITETDTNTTPIDTEMVIIVTTLIAAFCFITICCWLNRYKQDSINVSEKVSPETTTVKKGEQHKQDITAKPKPKTKHKHINKPRVNKVTPIKVTPIKVTQANKNVAKHRVSTQAAADTTYATVPKVDQENHNTKDDGSASSDVGNAKNTSRKKIEYENDLDVISEQHPAPTNTEMVYNPKTKKPLQFRADISDSETMKSPGDTSTCHTWDDFDQQNGILADRRNMHQMMGFLEEGAIACSYE